MHPILIYNGVAHPPSLYPFLEVAERQANEDTARHHCHRDDNRIERYGDEERDEQSGHQVHRSANAVTMENRTRIIEVGPLNSPCHHPVIYRRYEQDQHIGSPRG